MESTKRTYNGRTVWVNKKNKYHREDGPAVVFFTGHKYWFLDGKKYSEKQYKQEMYKRNLEKLNEKI